MVCALASIEPELSPMMPELCTKWVSEPNVYLAASNTRSNIALHRHVPLDGDRLATALFNRAP